MTQDKIKPAIGKTVGAILVAGSLALLPVAAFVTFAYLHTDHLTPYGIRFVVMMVWSTLVVLFMGPVLIIGLIPAFARFAYGLPRFRKKWIALQLIAWIGTLIFAAAGISYWIGRRNRGIPEALTFHAIPLAATAFALYLCVMSFMPVAFFEEDLMGKGVKGFLGVKSTKSVPLASFSAAVVLLGIGGMLWWVTATTFATDPPPLPLLQR